jgi:probable FeS assembly SUF system protein SufT
MFGSQNEPVVLRRDVAATVVPAGHAETLPAESLVYITQSMGGSFTVYFEGNLYRVAGRDADALGQEPTAAPALPENATDAEFEQLVWEQLRTVYDPEIPINIVELGLVYQCVISKAAAGTRSIDIKMTVTAPGCGMGEILVDDVREKLKLLPTVSSVTVELVFDPPWSQDMMSDAARLEAGLL